MLFSSAMRHVRLPLQHGCSSSRPLGPPCRRAGYAQGKKPSRSAKGGKHSIYASGNSPFSEDNPPFYVTRINRLAESRRKEEELTNLMQSPKAKV
eukprot:6102746-Pyramimonas_sp.AAC.1